MASHAKALITGIDTYELPIDTKELRKNLTAFLRQPIKEKNGLKIGGCTFGVYAFFDYDNEPIYVGQTRESLGTRIRRHLTNQRTDAVAMSVLDPFEVHTIKVWPLPELQGVSKKEPKTRNMVNDLESAVFETLLKGSKFTAVLNEKVPIKGAKIDLPNSYSASIVSAEVLALRGHPDVRLARRAATIARLAQVICERDVQPGLRRTLEIQARRLLYLANERLKPFIDIVASEDAKAESEEDREAQFITDTTEETGVK